MNIILITGEYCNRCKFIEPILGKYCRDNGCNLKTIDVNEAPSNLIEGASMLPIIRWEDEQIEYDEVLKRISA